MPCLLLGMDWLLVNRILVEVDSSAMNLTDYLTHHVLKTSVGITSRSIDRGMNGDAYKFSWMKRALR